MKSVGQLALEAMRPPRLNAWQQTFAALITTAVVQLLAMVPAQAGDRTKPYLSADARAPAAVAQQHESELVPMTQAGTPDAGTEQLEKLLLHSALADSSAFGLLQALRQPAKATPAAADPAATRTPGDCDPSPRKKT